MKTVGGCLVPCVEAGGTISTSLTLKPAGRLSVHTFFSWFTTPCPARRAWRPRGGGLTAEPRPVNATAYLLQGHSVGTLCFGESIRSPEAPHRKYSSSSGS